jgi:hypothetical protein
LVVEGCGVGRNDRQDSKSNAAKKASITRICPFLFFSNLNG